MKKDNPAAVYTKQGGREEREGSAMVREGRPVSSSLSPGCSTRYNKAGVYTGVNGTRRHAHTNKQPTAESAQKYQAGKKGNKAKNTDFQINKGKKDKLENERKNQVG